MTSILTRGAALLVAAALLGTVGSAQAPTFSVTPTSINVVHSGATGGELQVSSSTPTARWDVGPSGAWFSLMLAPTWSVLAGERATDGYVDGNGSQARFTEINDLALGPNGLLYVADRGNNRIRVVNPATGAVATFASVQQPYWLVVGRDGKLYVSMNSGLARYSLTTGQLEPYSFGYPPVVSDGLASVAADGAIYFVMGLSAVYRIAPDTGQQSLIAGSQSVSGYRDGVGTDARFGQISGLAVASDGMLYLADGSRIRRINLANQEVSTVAGGSEAGTVDGIGIAARLSMGRLVSVVDGELFLLSSDNLIRRITLQDFWVRTVRRVTPSIDGLRASVRAVSTDLTVYGLNVFALEGHHAVYKAVGGVGSGKAWVDVSPNLGPARTATLTVAGQSVTLTQDAVSFTLSPSAYNVPNTGGSQAVTVNTVAGVPWTVEVPATAASWLSVTGGSGTGPGSFSLTALPNSSSAVTRTATVTVGSATFTVTQIGATPTFTVTPPSWNAPAAGGSQVVAVTSSIADAPWTVSSLPSWVTATPTSGVGSGTVTLTVSAATGLESRAGTLSIAGQSVQVTQAGWPAPTVTPAVWSIPVGGGSQAVTITAASSQVPWTVSGLPLWVTATPTSGVGSGTVTLTVGAAPGVESRSGTATVAGTTVALTQAGWPAAPPGAPASFTASAAGDTLTFSWTPPATGGRPAGYYLQAGLAPGFSALAATLDIAGTRSTYQYVGAPAGRYYVKMRAYNDYGTGPASEERELLVGVTGASPGAPGTLTHTVTGDAVSFRWSAPTTGDPPTGYLLEAGTGPALTNIRSVPLGPQTQFDVNGVPPGTYYVRVRAQNSFGLSSASNEVVLTLGTTAEPPGAPSSLSSAVAGSTVTLTWLPPSTGGVATEYVLEAGSTLGGTDLVPGVGTGSTLTTYQATSVPPGRYYVRLRAKNLFGVSGPSNTVTVVVGTADTSAPPTDVRASTGMRPGAPTALQGVLRDRTLRVAWDAPSAGAAYDGYQVEVSAAAGGPAIGVLDVAPTSTSATATLPSGTYYVRVRARGVDGLSDPSNALLVIVPE